MILTKLAPAFPQRMYTYAVFSKYIYVLERILYAAEECSLKVQRNKKL